MSELPSVAVSPSILALQSAIAICKPRSIIPFSIRFLQDEKSIPAATLPIYHAVQMLPYLIAQPDDMRDTACSIFCALQTQPNLFNERPGALDSLPNPPTGSSTAAASGTVFREYLDGNQVSEVIQLMDLPSLGQSHPVVDEILIDRVESLKRVDFSLFFASVRLYLNVIQAVAWLKDDILDYLWTTEHVLRVPVPLTDDFSIEMTKWKVALLKRAASNTTNLGNSLPSQSKTTLFASGTSSSSGSGSSAKQALRQGPSRVTHNYHLHTHQSATNIAALLNAESSSSGHHNNAYGEQDVSQWKRTLLLVLEEERTAMMISVGVLVERFVKALLHYK